MRKFLTISLITAAAALLAPLAQAAEPGKPAPNFTLTDLDGKSHQLADFKGKVVVLEWYNPSCPFVVKHYETNNMQELQKKYTAKDVVWLTINSTNPEHKDYLDAAKAKEQAESWKLASTAVLLDPKGEAGKAYDAKTTPHMFIINAEGTLVYNGAIDDNSSADKSTVESAKNHVVPALDAILAGEAVATDRSKPYGCSVKYADA